MWTFADRGMGKGVITPLYIAIAEFNSISFATEDPMLYLNQSVDNRTSNPALPGVVKVL